MRTIISSHLNEDDDVLADLYRLIRNAGKRKRPVGITKETLFKSIFTRCRDERLNWEKAERLAKKRHDLCIEVQIAIENLIAKCEELTQAGIDLHATAPDPGNKLHNSMLSPVHIEASYPTFRPSQLPFLNSANPNRAFVSGPAIAGSATGRHGPVHTIPGTVHPRSRTMAQGPGRTFRWLDCIDGGPGGAD